MYVHAPYLLAKITGSARLPETSPASLPYTKTSFKAILKERSVSLNVHFICVYHTARNRVRVPVESG